MTFVLPDSKGSIHRILFHQTSTYRKEEQIRNGLLENFLDKLNTISVRPELFVFATYRDDSEKSFLKIEAQDWKHLVKRLNYVSIKVGNEIWSRLPYAQDVCLVLDSNKPAAIITKSMRFRNMRSLLSNVGKLLEGAELHIVKSERNFNLEGGYIYATSEILLYSNPEDQAIINTFKQKAIFVESVINQLLDKILNILYPGVVPLTLPNHVDMIFSVFEKEDSCYVFYVDFKEAILSSHMWFGNRLKLLERRFLEYDSKLRKTMNEIRRCVKDVTFIKMPGVIGFENVQYGEAAFVYSGTNLLFHSEKSKNYAFYLEFPNEIKNRIERFNQHANAQ